ncbi:cytidine deaminase [Geoalkalibacter halelectricus]|uniref:Cytidine deaminase n=1 Tax=Geoalkalibacter halelectricus TaxID=2847045 RepID=A0ABY5ZI93_9BACT|nr:cytidine deaminase [Geoalkalibacter halelectricus]MDO3378982.1 cytidine deaminase [Geoalkalibacter halelectricus]UWZ78798.1 cytidine deaminase [Geoalkalibacter halelectricus]
MPKNPNVVEDLIAAARQAARHSHAPYSGFTVGAALLSSSGAIFAGCNVENASYGLTLCAERVALGTAVAAGDRDFDTLVLYTPTAQPVLPCGACRQVLREFSADLRVMSVCDGPRRIDTTLAELFPQPFNPAMLSAREERHD